MRDGHYVSRGVLPFSLVMIKPRWILESLGLSCPQVLEGKSLIPMTSSLEALDHDVSKKGTCFSVFLFLKHESLKVFINKKRHSVIQ